MGLSIKTLLISSTALTALLAAQTPQEEPKGIIAGVVQRSDNLAPIKEVSVVLVGPQVTSPGSRTAPSQTIRTDIDGRFVFRGLAAGGYLLQASRDGYFGRNSAPLLNLGPGPVELVSNIRLDPGAIFSGRVLNEDGQPIPEVPVSFVSAIDGRIRSGSSGFSPRTNSQGEYRLGWIPPGEYHVRAEFPGSAQEVVNRTTYQPDSLDMETARRIIAAAGAEYIGLDIRVRKSGAVKVSGSIIRSEPAPENSSTLLNLYLYPSASRLPDARTALRPVDSATGRFEIEGVVPGEYELVVIEDLRADSPSIGPGNRQSRSSGRVSIGVGNRNIEGLSIVIKPPIEVRGRVTGIDVSLPKFLKVTLSNEGVSHFRPQGGTVDENGEFFFTGAVEGTAFHLSPYGTGFGELPPDLYLRDMRQGSRSIMNEGLIVFSSLAEPLELIVSSGSGSIEGSVARTERGTVGVIIAPSEPRRRNLALYRAASTDDENRFIVTGVTPGLYKVFSWEGFLPSPAALLDPEFLVRYEDRGTTVNVSSGTRVAGVRVYAIPKGQ